MLGVNFMARFAWHLLCIMFSVIAFSWLIIVPRRTRYVLRADPNVSISLPIRRLFMALFIQDRFLQVYLFRSARKPGSPSKFKSSEVRRVPQVNCCSLCNSSTVVPVRSCTVRFHLLPFFGKLLVPADRLLQHRYKTATVLLTV